MLLYCLLLTSGWEQTEKERDCLKKSDMPSR